MNKKPKPLWTWLLQQFHTDIAIDLGERYIKIYQKGKGIVLNDEFSCVIVKETKQILLIGQERKRCIGGPNPDKISLIFPLRDGVVSDFEIYEKTLRRFIKKLRINKFCIGHPTCLLAHPLLMPTELQGTKEVLTGYQVKSIETPMVPLIAANCALNKKLLSVHIGDGVTTMYAGDTIRSSKAESKSCAFRISYNKMVECLILHIRKKFNLLISEPSARRVIQLLTMNGSTTKKLPLKGRHLETGTPKEIVLRGDDVWQGIEKALGILDDDIAYFYEKQDKNTREAIKKNGIILSGPGALIQNIDKRIHKKLKCPVFITNDPENAVINGLGKILESPKNWKDFEV